VDVAAAEKIVVRATWRWSPSTGCRRMARLERHPLTGADARGGVARSWATTSTVDHVLPFPLSLPLLVLAGGLQDGEGRRWAHRKAVAQKE
jgi:hypothetical protein